MRPPPADSTVPRVARSPLEDIAPTQLYLRPVYAESADGGPLIAAPEHIGRGVSVVIGRAPATSESCIVLTDDPHASRVHTKVSAYDVDGERGLLVEDLGSRNGTFVNGSAITRHVSHEGDVLRVGGTVFVTGAAPPNATHAEDAVVVLRSWAMQTLWSKLQRVASSDTGVLFLGETGVGKTMLAKRIHELSPRATGPFLRHNCGAIPKNLEDATLFGVVAGFIPEVKARDGLLTRARGGTLFLDELADLDPIAQSKLLDAFDPTDASYLAVGGTQRLTTNCRLVTATNRDLFATDERGVVRADLLSRVVVTQLVIPPLRERREAILELFCRAVEEFGSSGVVTNRTVATVELAEALLIAPWVENVRGLRSLAQRVALGEELSIDMVTGHAGRGDGPPPPPTVTRPKERSWPPDERDLLLTLDAHGWCVADAAGAYGKRRETLARLIRRYFGPGGKQHALRAFQTMVKPDG